jgi:hypothetical protein
MVITRLNRSALQMLRQCTESNWPKYGARPATPASRHESPSPANTTWRQEAGGSAIEASKTAGHASTKITEDYTVVQLRRRAELTRRIQDKLAKAARRQNKKQKAATEDAAA